MNDILEAYRFMEKYNCPHLRWVYTYVYFYFPYVSSLFHQFIRMLCCGQQLIVQLRKNEQIPSYDLWRQLILGAAYLSVLIFYRAHMKFFQQLASCEVCQICISFRPIHAQFPAKSNNSQRNYWRSRLIFLKSRKSYFSKQEMYVENPYSHSSVTRQKTMFIVFVKF